ncbi:hypothetical protein EJB05_37188, partial [Eragrostis curvula]
MDYKRRGQTVDIIEGDEMRKMRHYIISNCNEASQWIDAHMEELKKYGTRNLKKRHEEQFVRWFEAKIRHLHAKGEVSSEMFGLAQGPDDRARTLHRCHINNWLFRTVDIEKSLVTQNSGVLVKGDGTTGNMNWYGVIKRMISLEFPGQKEVILFQCDWYDVPTATSNRGRGYNKDQFGVIDIDTTRYSVIALKPRDLFAMPELELEDSIDVGIEVINSFGVHQDLTNWTRSDKEGTTGDVSVIAQVQTEAVDEPDDAVFDCDDEDDEDDTYIDDGVVAPVASVARSIQNSRHRGQKKTTHLSGAKPYAQCSYEKKDPETGEEPNDMELWFITHSKDGQWKDQESRNVYDKASSLISEAESNSEGNFITVKEKNEIFQKAYKAVTACKSTRLHGNGYLAKNPTRRELLNVDRQEQIRVEEQLHQEHAELMESFGQLQDKMATWEADREAERIEHARQIDELNKARAADLQALRQEFLSMLQAGQGQTTFQQENPQRNPEQPEVDDISRATGIRTTRSTSANTARAFVTTKQLKDNAVKRRQGSKKTANQGSSNGGNK